MQFSRKHACPKNKGRIQCQYQLLCEKEKTSSFRGMSFKKELFDSLLGKLN